MKTTMPLVLGLALILMSGCAAFETTPRDVEQKLTHPLDGRLFVADSVNNPQKLAAY